MSTDTPAREIQVIMRDAIIKAAPERWEEAYRNYDRDTYRHNGRTKMEVTKALLALEAHERTAATISGIIGNDSWTSLKCDECEEDVAAAAQLADDLEYSGKKATICLQCLAAATQAVIKATDGGAS